MKGVILAGGLGSRLYPLTKITNKHLLPVYDQPMIFYPIRTLINAGIEDIMIVTGGNSAGDFLRLLGNGKEFGLKHLNYTYQEGEGGIADALSLVEHFADKSSICVVLGDNIIEGNIRDAADQYRAPQIVRLLRPSFCGRLSDPDGGDCPPVACKLSAATKTPQECREIPPDDDRVHLGWQ